MEKTACFSQSVSNGPHKQPDTNARWDKKNFLPVIAIFMLALSVRLLYLYESSDCPSFRTPIVDAQGYDIMARNFAEEGKMSIQFFRQPFFYPFFLSTVYYFSNSSIVCAKIIQAVLGAITCALGYKLAKKVFNTQTAFIAGVMMIFYGPLIYFQTKILGESWATFWTVVILLLFLKNIEKKNLFYCFLLGLCCALTIITRPTYLPFIALALIYLLIYRFVKGSSLTSIIASLMIILAGIVIIIIIPRKFLI